MENVTQATLDTKANSLVSPLRDKLDLIKRTVAKGATDDELEMFLHQCERTGLDPLAKQIYFVKRGYAGTIQTGIDGYRSIADRTNCYAPGSERFEYRGERLHKAFVTIKKLVAGTWHEYEGSALWDEYVGLGKDGHPTTMWARFGETMLAKCAESKALRKGFPAQLGGLYTAEEMMQADNESTEASSIRTRNEILPVYQGAITDATLDHENMNAHSPAAFQDYGTVYTPKKPPMTPKSPKTEAHSALRTQIIEWLVSMCSSNAADMADALEMNSQYWSNGALSIQGVRDPVLLNFEKSNPKARSTQAQHTWDNMAKYASKEKVQEALTMWREFKHQGD